MKKTIHFILLIMIPWANAMTQPTRIWGTYYGNSGSDLLYASAVDGNGDVYITGQTSSSSGISTVGSHQPAFGGGLNDVYLAKFNSAGVCQWATYYGGAGTGDEFGYAIAVDGSGNVYLAGQTSSASGISTPGSHQVTFGGAEDAFLVKFNSAGVRQWATYYGGAGSDIAHSVAVNGSGDIYLNGSTSSTGSISTLGSHQVAFGGGDDAFLVKFNNAGVRQWATYYGGIGNETGRSVTLDITGNVFFTGETSSAASISTGGSHQPSIGGVVDAYLVMFNSNGIRQWGTYYGGSFSDYGYSVVADVIGDVFISGSTSSANAISTIGSHQPSLGGLNDAFFARFNNAGVQQWASYYGGTGGDFGFCIALDGSGNIYLAGRTSSSSGISTLGSHQPTFGGIDYGYLVQFNNAGQRQWGTYYGGSSSESGHTVCVDANDKIYLAGRTSSVSGISTTGSHQPGFGGIDDSFLVQFLGCANIVGVSINTYVNAACNGDCNGYATATPNGTGPFTYLWTPTGQTSQTALGLCAGVYTVVVTGNGGCTATTTVNITEPPVLNATVTTTNASCGTCCDGTATVLPTGGCPPYSYMWSPMGQTTQTAAGLCPGNYVICVTDACGCSTCVSVSVNFSVGIQNDKDEIFSVSPNPFRENLAISLPGTASEIILLNSLGEVVGTWINATGFVTIDTKNLPDGFYFLRLLSEGKVHIRKVVRR